MCPLSKAHQKARAANGTGGETGRSALPPPDLHPATCSPIESLGRRHQSLRMLTRRRCDARRSTRQMCGVALRREPPAICARSAARPQRGHGDGRQGRAPPRCGLREDTPCVADRANSPRGPQRRAIDKRPTSGRACFSGQSSVFWCHVPAGGRTSKAGQPCACMPLFSLSTPSSGCQPASRNSFMGRWPAFQRAGLQTPVGGSVMNVVQLGGDRSMRRSSASICLDFIGVFTSMMRSAHCQVTHRDAFSRNRSHARMRACACA